MSLLFLFKLGNGITNRFFKCLSTVLVNLGFVLFTVGKTSCIADTTADTSHAFDKVTVENTFVQLEQGSDGYTYNSSCSLIF